MTNFSTKLKGVAMDIAWALSIANLFMAHIENTFINIPEKSPFFDNIFIKRFLDDLFLLFRDQTKLPAYFDRMNKLHPSLKFPSN